jgi:hypothetical protein
MEQLYLFVSDSIATFRNIFDQSSDNLTSLTTVDRPMLAAIS